MTVTQSEQAKRLSKIRAALVEASHGVRNCDEQIAGLRMTPPQKRLSRLKEIQQERRDKLADFYLAKEEMEELTWSPPEK